METNCPYHTLKVRSSSAKKDQMKQRLRRSVRVSPNPASPPQTRHVLSMSVSAVYHGKIGEVCVCESGLSTSECLPGQIVGFGGGAGRHWSRSPYVVTAQMKKMKVSEALQRQMDTVTHSQAGRRLAADQVRHKLKGRRECCCASLCV